MVGKYLFWNEIKMKCWVLFDNSLQFFRLMWQQYKPCEVHIFLKKQWDLRLYWFILMGRGVLFKNDCTLLCVVEHFWKVNPYLVPLLTSHFYLNEVINVPWGWASVALAVVMPLNLLVCHSNPYFEIIRPDGAHSSGFNYKHYKFWKYWDFFG